MFVGLLKFEVVLDPRVPWPRYSRKLTFTVKKKMIDCFNHRVVTLVADKLRRQWL